MFVQNYDFFFLLDTVLYIDLRYLCFYMHSLWEILKKKVSAIQSESAWNLLVRKKICQNKTTTSKI